MVWLGDSDRYLPFWKNAMKTHWPFIICVYLSSIFPVGWVANVGSNPTPVVFYQFVHVFLGNIQKGWNSFSASGLTIWYYLKQEEACVSVVDLQRDSLVFNL